MHLALLALGLQLGLVAQPLTAPQGRPVSNAADSARDLRAARSAQSAFERTRRYSLPEGGGSSGRCDVQLGRYCWWYDEVPPDIPPEAGTITRRRAELLATLDALGERRPGDDWIAGMRVHYRIDAKNPDSADSVARACRASTWWCHALVGYAGYALGRAAAAESAFTAAVGAMSESEACGWRDISVLLPANTRRYYEKLSCTARRPVEERYWMLSRPRLGAEANDWRTEFYVRRVLATLYRDATSTLQGSWGRDNEELLLRYGWPIGWRRSQTSYGSSTDILVTEYHQVPSYNFAPVEALYDTSAAAQDDGWELESRTPEARYSPRLVTRVAPVAMQVARFRRGDSVLVVAAHAAAHDSLRTDAEAVLALALPNGTTRSVPAEGPVGTARITVEAFPMLAGVEVTDTVT